MPLQLRRGEVRDVVSLARINAAWYTDNATIWPDKLDEFTNEHAHQLADIALDSNLSPATQKLLVAEEDGTVIAGIVYHHKPDEPTHMVIDDVIGPVDATQPMLESLVWLQENVTAVTAHVPMCEMRQFEAIGFKPEDNVSTEMVLPYAIVHAWRHMIS